VTRPASWCSPAREYRDSIPERRGTCGPIVAHLPPLMCLPRAVVGWDGGDGGTMAKKNTAAKQLAEVTARANARFTINLQRAFVDLCGKLNQAYGQPARDAAEMRSRHVFALMAIARFLKRVGPHGDLAHFADQFAKFAQALQDLHDGIRAPIFTPALANRSDQTAVWLARAHVALAVETMRQLGQSRGRATKWAAKKHPDLKQLITESGADLDRSKSLEKAMISWCEDFTSRKVKNRYAARTYAEGLGKLRAWAVSRNSDQMEDEQTGCSRKLLS